MANHAGRADPGPAESPALRLQTTMAAARVSFTWLGVRKTLTADQKAQAAEPFGAEGQFLSAAKKLLDTGHPAFRAVTAVRNRIVSYWRGVSLPYPEPAIRLIRRDRIGPFNDQMTDFKQELADGVTELDRQFDELKDAARIRLGSLYNPADYPPTLTGLFACEWEFPSVQPPQYLLELNPALYEQERARMAARFQEAVTLAEQGFLAEFGKLVSHLVERLSGSADGEKKIFRDSAVTQLGEFFSRFRELNVGSNAKLEELVALAQRAVRGVDPQELRNNDGLRQHIAGKLSAVQGQLDGLMIDRPRRRILRPMSSSPPPQEAVA
jgi:hypothetical protein